MTVKKIVENYLRENDYEGLQSEECGCRLDDLIPCGECCDNCEAGYKVIITAKNRDDFDRDREELEIGDWVICKERDDD